MRSGRDSDEKDRLMFNLKPFIFYEALTKTRIVS